ncbi:MAG: ribonuclease HII [Deltaproteobacteria bacterium]|nr:ribonuclease HII [Deltaproteobacteria bacterium]
MNGKKAASLRCSPPEDDLYRQGYRFIAGLDEAGRGPLAGPVVAAAVILPKDHSLEGILDSKELSPVFRDEVFDKIRAQAVAVGFGVVDQWEIDRVNILRCTLKAMEIAVSHLNLPVEYLLIDGLHTINAPLPQLPVKHGDYISPLMGAASVIAKVIRDRIMDRFHELYPRYNFAKNRGYGTQEHRDVLKAYGFCSLHRKTFQGVRCRQDLLL